MEDNTRGEKQNKSYNNIRKRMEISLKAIKFTEMKHQ